MSGYVYFAAFPPNFIKIGHSIRPLTRIRSIRRQGSAVPSQAKIGKDNGSLLGVIDGDSAIEHGIHTILARFLVSGCREWFHDGKAIRRKIRTFGLRMPPKESSFAQIPIGYMRISPRIPPQLVKELKDECKRDGRIMEAAIAVAVREWLDRKKVMI